MAKYILLRKGGKGNPTFLAAADFTSVRLVKTGSTALKAFNLRILKWDSNRYFVNLEKNSWNDIISYSFIYPEYKETMIIMEDRDIAEFPDDESAILYYEVMQNE